MPCLVMSSFEETGISSGVLYFSASLEIAAAHFDVYGPTMPATLSRVASFSNAAIAFSGLPVSSSRIRSTSMPCFFRSSMASVTPLVRFSPIGASAPVIVLMKPTFTFAAPCAKEGTNNAIAIRRTMNRFIPCSFLRLEVEELHLNGGLVLVPADRGMESSDCRLDVEVVAVRVPVQADEVALLVLRGARAGEVALLVATPRSELRAFEVEAAVDDENIALPRQRWNGRAAVQTHEARGAGDRAEAERPIHKEVGGRSFVCSLLVPRRADGDDLLRAEKGPCIRWQVVDLGAEEVVLKAGDLPEGVARAGLTQTLEESGPPLEVIVESVAAAHESGVAAASAGQRSGGGVGV